MKDANPPHPRTRFAARCVAGLLSLYLLFPLVAVQSSVAMAAQSAHSTKQSRKRTQPGGSAYATRIEQEIAASAELRPLAQQLATMRTAATYNRVANFARQHSGTVAAVAYLALGHAYLLDKHYRQAAYNFRLALARGGELSDYAEFLGAVANYDAGNDPAALAMLRGFHQRYPGSIFADEAPVMETNVLLAMHDAVGAQKALAQDLGTKAEGKPAFRLADAQVALALGQRHTAIMAFKHLLLDYPLSSEAQVARDTLSTMGPEAALTILDRRVLGNAFYRAGLYRAAAEQFHVLANTMTLSAYARDKYAVAEDAARLKLGWLTWAEAESLPDTNDENGARRLYLLMELARNQQDTTRQQSVVKEMEARFPHSPWLKEALFSSGNMYLLRRDYPMAIEYYTYLADHFPSSSLAPFVHWRAAWLSYRLGNYQEATRLFATQIQRYPDATETVTALYWQGRLFQMQDHAAALAARNYRAIVLNHPNYYYAQLARVRLMELGDPLPVVNANPARYPRLPQPQLINTYPPDSAHLAKARLLANAGLNEYVPREIAADPHWSSWGSLAEAQIYSACGDNFRALFAMQRAIPDAASIPIQAVPLAYWRILFPKPWWNTIKAESAKYKLDPYLVVSLMRQESAFNPSAVSYANAYGLMQLLPRVGRKMALQLGMRNFRTYQLLNPQMNIRLGVRYLYEMLNKFGGVDEYALAAYNAGDYRVADWKAEGPYSGMDEFVESIPFTQTRNYVESILRNEELYKAIDAYARTQAGSEETASR